MKLLFLSNGHGEDAIAASIAAELRDLDPVALPLVGTGGAFRRKGIPVVGPTLELPSGGFNTHDAKAFRGDLRAGLGGLLWRQLRFLRSAKPTLVVAVGDLLPVFAGKLSSGNLIFVGANKSDFYRNPGYRYLPIELGLLKHWNALVFPRDEQTHRRLQKAGVRSEYLGNPMMDTFSLETDPEEECLALFPGSREEAYRNLAMMVPVVEAIRAKDARYSFEVALAPSLSEEKIDLSGIAVSRDFGKTLGKARLVIGMAGTASEQAVGLGKPVISWPGEGPQYTERFAKAQQDLLGEALQVLAYDPEAIAERVLETLQDEAYLARLPALGMERLGERGAAGRIAAFIRALA